MFYLWLQGDLDNIDGRGDEDRGESGQEACSQRGPEVRFRRVTVGVAKQLQCVAVHPKEDGVHNAKRHKGPWQSTEKTLALEQIKNK